MSDEYKDDVLDEPEEVDEFQVIAHHIRALALRDAGHAQHFVALALSNCAAGDGFEVMLDSSGAATTVEILGQDDRRLVIAPLLQWGLEGGPWGEAWEWGMRSPDGRREPCPTGDDALDDVWGSVDVGIDLARGINFYRRALEDVSANEGFMPRAATPPDDEVRELVYQLDLRP